MHGCTTKPHRSGPILAGVFSDSLLGVIEGNPVLLGALADGDPALLGALTRPEVAEEFDLDSVPEDLAEPMEELLTYATAFDLETGRTWTGLDLDGETQAAGAMFRGDALGRFMLAAQRVARNFELYVGGKEGEDGWTLVYLSALPGVRTTTLLDDANSTEGYDDTEDFLSATAGVPATLGALGQRIRARVSDRRERRAERRSGAAPRGLRNRRLARRADRLERKQGRIQLKLDRFGRGTGKGSLGPQVDNTPTYYGGQDRTVKQTKYIQPAVQYDPFADQARYQQAAMMAMLAQAQIQGLTEQEAVEDIDSRLSDLVYGREESADSMMFKPRQGRGFTAREIGRSSDGYLPPSLSMSGAYPDSLSIRGLSPLPGGGEEDPVKLARFWRRKGIYMTAPYDKPEGPVIVRMSANNWAPRKSRLIFPSSSRDLRFLGSRTHLSWPAGGQG